MVPSSVSEAIIYLFPFARFGFVSPSSPCIPVSFKIKKKERKRGVGEGGEEFKRVIHPNLVYLPLHPDTLLRPCSAAPTALKAIAGD